MITLNFSVDQKVLEEEKKYPPENDQNFLAIRFMFPIYFMVDGINICEFEDSTPVSIALLDLATEGLYTVESLKEKEEMTYDAMEDAGQYYFSRNGDKVLIKNNMNKHQAIASYRELLSIFNEFPDKVRYFLLKEFPELKHHERWGLWFKGKIKYL